MRQLLVFFCVFSYATLGVAGEQVFRSGESQVQLVELFTSEGCSSCPPADRWMSRLKSDEGLWKSFVPVAFHVDYWDYIGWPDRFAEREYSQRQRRYAAEFSESTVYTPGLRLAGQEWRGWRRATGASLRTSGRPTMGNLELKVAGESFKASYQPVSSSDQGPYQLSLALLGLDLSTDVKRGENRGETLQHDFVVLGITTISALTDSQEIRWQGSLPEASASAPKYALAAWVSQAASQVPIQALGGELRP